MTINVTWDDDAKTTVHILFEPNWTWDEVYGIYDRYSALIESVPYHVDVLVNLVYAPNLSSGLNIRKINQYVAKRHPKTSHVFIYNVHPIVVPLINTLLRSADRYQLTLAQNEADAREKLAAHRMQA